MTDRFSIRQAVGEGWSCPSEVLAVYAHDEDFDYSDFLSEGQKYLDVIKALDDCIQPAQIFALGDSFPAKPLGSATSWLQEQVQSHQVIHFDLKQQKNEKIRILCWVKIINHDVENIKVIMPQRISTKYLTVKFISSNSDI